MRHLHDTWICSAALLCALLSARASAADSWSYEASPFLWAAGIDGREGPSSLAPDVHADFKDLVDFVDVGAALRLVARRPPVGWFAEASYVSLKDDISLPTGGTLSVRSTDTFAEGGLLYELNSAFAVYGGVRYQGIERRSPFPRASRATRRTGSTQ